MNREAFGSLLRAIREDRGKSMSALARHVGVSPSYISEVEQCRRAPLTRDKILQAAEFLNTDPLPLVRAALEWNGILELNVDRCSMKGKEIGAYLALGWEHLSEKDLEAIGKIIRQKQKEAVM